jgi:hypothetical protein
MATGDDRIQIIGNESNHIYEAEAGGNSKSSESNQNPEREQVKEQPVINDQNNSVQPGFNDLATNDGAVVETLDTAFHNKPGVTEGTNPSGSNRADYYESKDDGENDSQEELGALNRQ